MRTADVTRTTLVNDRSRPLISWGAIFGGAILGLALLALLSSLWFALGYGSEVDTIRDNLEWFVGGSAVACLFIAGIVTGYLAGVRSVSAGLLNALALWALLLVLTLSVGIPAILNVFSLGRVATEVDATTTAGLVSSGAGDTMWASFWTILGAAAAAGLGGMIGGAMTREYVAAASTTRGVDRDRDLVDDDDDDDEVVRRRVV